MSAMKEMLLSGAVLLLCAAGCGALFGIMVGTYRLFSHWIGG